MEREMTSAASFLERLDMRQDWNLTAELGKV
jgi:hypothetical protein